MKKIFISSLILANIILTLISIGNNANTSSFTLNDIFVKAEASNEAIQFCTKDYMPYWGICNFTGNGYDCFYIAPDCAMCDCDGTWIMEL